MLAGNWTQEAVISQFGQMCTIVLYVVTVQSNSSIPIHLTVTEACRLAGLPAATLNEELDPACVRVGMCARVCMSVCKCACV